MDSKIKLIGNDTYILEQIFYISKTKNFKLEVSNFISYSTSKGRDVELELNEFFSCTPLELKDITCYKVYFFFIELILKLKKRILLNYSELLSKHYLDFLQKRTPKFIEKLLFKKKHIGTVFIGKKKKETILIYFFKRRYRRKFKKTILISIAPVKLAVPDICFEFKEYFYRIKMSDMPELIFPDDETFLKKISLERQNENFDALISIIGFFFWEERHRLNRGDIFSFLGHLITCFKHPAFEKEREGYLFHFIYWHKLRCHLAQKEEEYKEAMTDYIELFTSPLPKEIDQICTRETELRELWTLFENREIFIELLKRDRELLSKISNFLQSRFKFWTSIFPRPFSRSKEINYFKWNNKIG